MNMTEPTFCISSSCVCKQTRMGLFFYKTWELFIRLLSLMVPQAELVPAFLCRKRMPFAWLHKGGGIFFICALFALVYCSVAIAGTNQSLSPEGWNRALTGHSNLPGRFLAVNKKAQQLLIVEKQNPHSPVATLACSTGQVDGDKWLEGDKKTPEGVYFVGRKISSGLDYEEYGGLAYVLNYPNPVDRLRDKKGHGIWVHGKGYVIVPKDTQGCIALNTNELMEMDPIMEAGLPVVVAEKLEVSDSTEKANAQIAVLLRGKVKRWADAWANRSPEFFDYYLPEAYSRAQGEDFAAFRAQKQRIFSMFSWIQIWIDDIRILEGPGYWVTWFAQYYRAPNLSTEGIRRLYWQQDTQGEWRIVGMEWEPFEMGLEKVYLGRLKEEMDFFVEAWRRAWESGNLDSYVRFYADDAVQDNRQGKSAIKEFKQRTWRQARPRMVRLQDLQISFEGSGVKVTMKQVYRNSSGYEDFGIKTLFLWPDGRGGWQIASEYWRAL